MRILIVEDDARLRRAVRRVLEQEGHTVEEANDGPTGLAFATGAKLDVIILDVMMPGLDGFQVSRGLRAAGVDTPVLMLTARGEVNDRVVGLDSGADDYLTKPFAFKELLARLRALARRRRPTEDQTTLVYEDLELDLLRHEARRSGRRIALTSTEFRLLEFLMRNRTIVLSRSRILDEIWGLDYDGESNVVDTYIHYLRRKVDADDGVPLIRTIRGSGYVLGG